MTKQVFPYPCSRCGLCCMMKSCRFAQEFLNVGPDDPCPAFELNAEGNESSCRVVTQLPNFAGLLGIGAGCCVKARVFMPNGDPIPLSFEALPPDIKREIVLRNEVNKVTPVGNVSRTITEPISKGE